MLSNSLNEQEWYFWQRDNISNYHNQLHSDYTSIMFSAFCYVIFDFMEELQLFSSGAQEA